MLYLREWHEIQWRCWILSVLSPWAKNEVRRHKLINHGKWWLWLLGERPHVSNLGRILLLLGIHVSTIIAQKTMWTLIIHLIDTVNHSEVDPGRIITFSRALNNIQPWTQVIIITPLVTRINLSLLPMAYSCKQASTAWCRLSGYHSLVGDNSASTEWAP